MKYAILCILQAEELKAHSEKRMKELEKEIQECERAKVLSSIELHIQSLTIYCPVYVQTGIQDCTCMLTTVNLLL